LVVLLETNQLSLVLALSLSVPLKVLPLKVLALSRILAVAIVLEKQQFPRYSRCA